MSKHGIYLPVLTALAIFAILSVPLISEHYSLFGHTRTDNLFAYLAWSFIHGRLDLIYVPDCQRDLSWFHGKAYAYWPPLPAFVLMPWVWLHGLYLGDRWLTVAFVAITVFAAWLLMDALANLRGWQLSNNYKILLSIFLAFGTLNLIAAIAGGHHLFAQICACMMMMIAMASVFSLSSKWWHFLLCGTFWALAILARGHLILAAPLFIYLAVFGAGTSMDWHALKWRQILYKIAALFLPVFGVLLFFAWYNLARFGSIFDNGISYHLMAARFLEDYKLYGYINPHYFWHNLYYTVLRFPFFTNIFREPGSYTGWEEGYSLFFQSPAFLFALWSLRYTKQDMLVSMLWLAAGLVSIPIFWLMGTGWVQYGARYLFDLCPFLFPLVIIGTRGRSSVLLILLVMASVASNIYGINLLKELYSPTHVRNF